MEVEEVEVEERLKEKVSGSYRQVDPVSGVKQQEQLNRAYMSAPITAPGLAGLPCVSRQECPMTPPVHRQPLNDENAK